MDTFDIIRRLAIDTLNVAEEPLLRATTLNEAGIDSLAAIDLVFAIEGHFGISLSASELARVRSLQNLAAIVQEHRHDE
jgi:acyl carrier protein